MAKDDKLKALDAAIAQIERQYGKGSVMKLGDNSANMNVETVPTGSLSLDTTYNKRQLQGDCLFLFPHLKFCIDNTNKIYYY